MKRPIALTIVAVWVIVAGVFGVIVTASALNPSAPNLNFGLDFGGPIGLTISVIGSLIYVYAGFELLRMHRRGLYALLVATGSRLMVVIIVYEHTGVGSVSVVGTPILMIAWIAIVLWYSKTLT